MIGCFELDGVLVDPGPASCVDVLLEAIGDRPPRALLLTHIHLDHAGASGALVERWPELEVYVHARGPGIDQEIFRWNNAGNEVNEVNSYNLDVGGAATTIVLNLTGPTLICRRLPG